MFEGPGQVECALVGRERTGAGMMDCKKALEENGGDIEAAKQWLREKGLAASAKRDDRDNAQGLVAILVVILLVILILRLV